MHTLQKEQQVEEKSCLSTCYYTAEFLLCLFLLRLSAFAAADLCRPGFKAIEKENLLI